MDKADIFNLFYVATLKLPRWSDYLQNNGQEDFIRLVHEKLFKTYLCTLSGTEVIIMILLNNK